jgi:redox-sensing transcriptional repressor
VPPNVSVVGVDLSVQLEHLAYKVWNTQAAVAEASRLFGNGAGR